MKIKVMTYNICSGRNFNNNRAIDVHAYAKVIQKYLPDIIGLNEVRGLGNIEKGFTNQTKSLAEKLGYYYYFAKAIELEGKGPYGNALLSRFPIIFSETIAIEEPLVKDEGVHYEKRCILKAKLDVLEGSKLNISGGLNVFVSHYGLTKDEQLNAIKKTIEILKGGHGKFIFMGDLNMQPNDEKMDSLHGLMKDTACISEEQLFTFPSHIPHVPKRKIDYILVSKDIKIISVKVPHETISDHRPYCAEIEL